MGQDNILHHAGDAEGRANILVVDDTPQNLDLLLEILSAEGYEVRPAKSGRMALESARAIPPDLILLDIMMPEINGFEVCRLLKQDERTQDVPVIFISALEDVSDKIRAFESGGVDYVTKPFQAEEILARVRTHVTLRRIRNRLEEQKIRLEREIAERQKTEKELSVYQEHLAGILEKRLRHPEAFRSLVTRSETMRSLFQYVEALGCSSEPVLITGESGVGKELIAKAIHDVSHPAGPWVPVNIAGLDDNVLSDTLFGHVRGAFTGADRDRAGMIERAAGGTLFLDEIGDLSPVSQIKLLRLLQEKEYFPLGSDQPREVRARIVVATNVDLDQKQRSKEFRKDLFFRLGTHRVEVPPLRDRPEDISVLLDHFLEAAAREMNKKKPTPPPELSVLLENYPFPGNVRELRAMVFNAVSMHGGRKLSMASFQKAMGETGGDLQREEMPPVSFHGNLPTLKDMADLLVSEAMERAKGNQSMAARLLGISQPALSSRLKKMNR